LPIVGIHFQLDGAASVLPGDVQGLLEQCPTDAPTAMLGDYEEFVEPATRPPCSRVHV
jgi:hypothetical protein